MQNNAIHSIKTIKNQAKELVNRGLLSRQQPIYAICQFIPAGEWRSIELELELHEFLLRDHVIDLLQPETWENNCND